MTILRRALTLLLVPLLVLPIFSSSAPASPPVSCVKFGGNFPGGEKVTLDPANQLSGENVVLVDAIYNRLLDMDSSLRVHPELAESWRSTADAKEWTFNLRRGVKFSDGKELVADDVVWTFERLLDPATGSEATPSLAFLKNSSITALDKYTVRFKLDQPAVEFPSAITTKNTWIVEKGATTETIKLKGVGTGPFIPEGFAPGQQIHRLIRNPNYWEHGLPMAQCLEIYEIPDPTTRDAALLSGQIDVSEGVVFSAIGALVADKRIKLVESSGPAYVMSLSMWVDTPPFNDVRVRRALKMIVNRKKILDTIVLGHGIIGDDNPIPPTSTAAWRKKQPGADIDGAKQLLNEAGYGPSKPLKIDLFAAEIRPGVVAFAQLFKEMALQAGVEVNVIVGPSSEWADTVWLKQPFITSTWASRPPGDALALAYRSTSPINETHWKRPEYDTILDQASKTADPTQRLALYGKAARMLTEDGGVIMPVFVNVVAATRAACDGYVPHAQAIRVDLRKIHCN
ncbi:MAG TPA: ABC transporter substrate-binding protein [bacterium]|nr:ABC transporter substrate-binding protein [bacterium]